MLEREFNTLEGEAHEDAAHGVGGIRAVDTHLLGLDKAHRLERGLL